VSAKDAEIARVAAELDGLLDCLRANVDALNAILTRPAEPGGEADERLVFP
jgi:hypothetical protein